MRIGDLVRQTKIPYEEEKLIPLSSITTKEKQMQLKEKYQIDTPLYEQATEMLKKHGIEPKYIFITPEHNDSFCYYNFPVLIAIGSLHETYLSFFKLEERIKMNESVVNKALEEGDYVKILALSNDNAKIMLLNKLYWQVSQEKRYGLWLEIYQLLDYGHGLIDKNIIKDAIVHQPTSYRNKMLHKLEKSVKGEYVTVYRGIGTHSTVPEQSMSWSLSLSVACYFANRYEQEGKVYKASIKKKHVIDYLRNRREEEILLNPIHLENVEELHQISLKGEMKILSEEGYVDEYCTYRNSYLEETDYLNPDSIHGVKHVKRVLFHALSMAKHLKLSASERAILANSALYHDIGRRHDGECTEHGKWSWRKFQNKMKESPMNSLTEINYVQQYEKGLQHYELRLLSEEEQEIVRFIIEYHCRSDKEAKVELNNRRFLDENRVWNLYEIFKDADALDRVRLSRSDLNISYLRTGVAKERILLAHNLLQVKQL